MLTKIEYEAAKLAIAKWESNRDAKGVWTGGTVTREECDTTNKLKSAIEVYEFCQDPPARYFLYIKPEGMPPASIAPRDMRYRGVTRCGSSGLATTWTGEKLGDVQFGTSFRSSFGDERVSIRVYAINGKTYAGTFYKSAGDYARVKMLKEKGGR